MPIQISRFGVIPKGDQPGKWRLIVDLSHPRGYCVNDSIEPELCSLHYTSVDKAVQIVLEYEARMQLAKCDIESAYRSIPMHSDDRWVLGMSWKGGVYVDTVLPFGLRSVPKIYSVVADVMQWLMEGSGVWVIHPRMTSYFWPPSDGRVCGGPGKVSETMLHPRSPHSGP